MTPAQFFVFVGSCLLFGVLVALLKYLIDVLERWLFWPADHQYKTGPEESLRNPDNDQL